MIEFVIGIVFSVLIYGLVLIIFKQSIIFELPVVNKLINRK